MSNPSAAQPLPPEAACAALPAYGRMTVLQARMLGPLQLAYIGDGVHDLYVRAMLLAEGLSVHNLHRRATGLVCAHAQARWLAGIAPLLTEEEAEVARRGRNAHARHAAPKHADPAEYTQSTALEALWGYLYLSGQGDRLETLLRAGLTAVTQDDGRREGGADAAKEAQG